MNGITPEAREAAIEAIRDGWHNGEGEADMASETGYVRFGEHGLDFIPPTRALDALIALGWAPVGVSSHPTREQIARVLWDANFPDIPWEDRGAWADEFAAIEFNADALLAAGLWTTPAGGDVSAAIASAFEEAARALAAEYTPLVNRTPDWREVHRRLLEAAEAHRASGSVPTETEGNNRG